MSILAREGSTMSSTARGQGIIGGARKITLTESGLRHVDAASEPGWAYVDMRIQTAQTYVLLGIIAEVMDGLARPWDFSTI